MSNLAFDIGYPVIPEPSAPQPPVTTSGGWSPQFVFDLALAMEPQEDICANHNVTQDQLLAWSNHPAFRKALSDAAREVRENGVTFKMKARIAAEEYLLDMHSVIRDPATPASVKVDAIHKVAGYGGYVVKEEKGTSTPGQSFNIQINL